jgi:hypothetical protein
MKEFFRHNPVLIVILPIIAALLLIVVFFIHRLLGYRTCCGIEIRPRDFKYILE